MTIGWYYGLHLAALVTVLCACVGAEAEECLRLQIESGKSVYSLSEPIVIRGTLTNDCGEIRTVNHRFAFPEPDVYLRIRDQRGKELSWGPPAPPLRLKKSDFTQLHAGGQLRFELREIKWVLSSPMVPGRYSVQAEFVNRPAPEIGIETRGERVLSNIVEMEIR